MNIEKQNIGLACRYVCILAILTGGLLLCLLACQPFELVPGYGKIQPRHLLMIPHEGKLHITWEARHLIVTMKGSVRQGILSVYGNIKRNLDLKKGDRLENIVVNIYFTNKVGKILHHDVLHSSGSPPLTKNITNFHKEYKLHKTTTHIAFGYDLKTGNSRHRHFPVK